MSGSGHWWRQRLSSVLLIPLCLWLLWAGASVAGANHAGAVAFLAHPVNALLAAATVAITAWHAQSGLQVIIEDYIDGDTLPKFLILLARLACALAALATCWAAWRIASGGAA